jgi:hypothetical protein
MHYTCDWHAPVLAEPDPDNSTLNFDSALFLTAGNVHGFGVVPLNGNGMFLFTLCSSGFQ